MKNLLILLSFLYSQSMHAQEVVTSEIKPIVIVAPQYPKEAILARIEGYVDVQFTVDTNGSVKDIWVINAKPKNIFNKTAIQAVLKYKFSPQMLNNEAVEQVVTQRINFKLPDELLSKEPNLLEFFARNKPSSTEFMAVYDLYLEIQGGNNIFTEVMVVDSKEDIKDELLVWQNKKEQIPNFVALQDKVIKQARSDFLKTHGAFNQFQKLCLLNSCPPILLSKLNSMPYEGVVKFIKIKVSMSIDVEGKVVDYKLKKIPRKYKNNPDIKQMILQLKFLPATKNNEPVISKITATIKVFTTSQKINFFLWGKERLHLLKKTPINWVRVALLRDKKGTVIDAKAMDSSHIKFEASAVKAVKEYKFKKSKSIQQNIKLIKFEEAN